jgi:hypothetical protein
MSESHTSKVWLGRIIGLLENDSFAFENNVILGTFKLPVYTPGNLPGEYGIH